MLITAPYQNNIITRAHPTIILVTRDRLLLSTSLPRYSGKLLRSREKKRFEFIYSFVFTSSFVLMEIQISPRPMKKRFKHFGKLLRWSFRSFRSTLFVLSGAYKDFIWYFSWKLREKFRNVKVFRSFRFVISRFIEKLWKFWKISISYINSFRPRKKKKRKTSGKVFASRENPRHFTCWLEESWFPVQFIGCRTYRLNINL